MLDVGPKTADAGLDRLAVLGVFSDLARQRQQLQRQFKLHVGGRGAFWNPGALRFFALGVILRLAELDVGAEASRLHRDVEIRFRVLAKDAVGGGFAVGGKRAGVSAFRIIRTADKRAELAAWTHSCYK